MKLQVLMATMDLKSGTELPDGIKELLKNKVKCTVINQCSAQNDCLNSNQDNLSVFSFLEKGLSKSRNRNLKILTEPIALITDQDIRFKKEFQNTIISAFDQYPEADIITFQIEDDHGQLLKPYRKEAFWMNHRDIMKVSSVEIAFKATSILNNQLWFDEDFGLGTIFPTGEEAIFLSDALKKGLKIKYVPFPIVIHSQDSSGHQFSNNKSLIRAKGAMFYRIFGFNAYVISIFFAIKKFKLSSETFVSFVKNMFEGISSYKKLRND